MQPSALVYFFTTQSFAYEYWNLLLLSLSSVADNISKGNKRLTSV